MNEMAGYAAARAGLQARNRQAPQHVFFVTGKMFRLFSVYVLFKFLVSNSGVSVSVFMFFSLVVSAAAFLVLQRPWVGRPLANAQIVPTVVNGAVLALSLVTWGKSLAACGPVRTVLAEYTGAALGAASTFALGRGGQKLKKAGGLAAILLAFVLLARGWDMASLSPFSHSSTTGTGNEPGPASITLSFIAGSLLALRRIVARRVSTKSYMKKRLHSVTVAAAACFLFPVAMFQLAFGESSSTNTELLEGRGSITWAYLTTITFGIVSAFYVDTYSEDRLHIHPTSPLHFLITSGLLILFEFIYGTDFSLVGFLICASILGLGIFESTSTSSYSSEDTSVLLPTEASSTR